MFYKINRGHYSLLKFGIVVFLAYTVTSLAIAEHKASGPGEKAAEGTTESTQSIKGVVEELTEDHAKVNAGEVGELNPRYLPLNIAREKGISLKKGDKVEIILNSQNLVVDYRLIGNDS